jgi:hypothetical protein
LADPVQSEADVSAGEFAEAGSADQSPVHATYQNIVAMMHDLLSDGLGRDASRYEEQERSFQELLSCLR